MKPCPYCDGEIAPHYTQHKTPKGLTWVAYCPVCGARTLYYKGGKTKTLEQAKTSWNSFDIRGTVDTEDVPMQTFSPD